MINLFRKNNLCSTMIVIPLLVFISDCNAQTNVANLQKQRQQKVVTGFAHGFKDSTWLYFEEVTKQGTAAEEMIDSSIVIIERFSESIKYFV